MSISQVKADPEAVAQNIKMIRYRILETQPYMYLIVAKLSVVVTNSVSTMAVSKDGKLAVNPAFWRSLSDPDKVVVLLHEALHRVLAHHERARELDTVNTMLWNIATDAVINGILLKLYPYSSVLKMGVTYDSVHKLLNYLNPDIASKYTAESLEKMDEEQLYQLLVRAVKSSNLGYSEAVKAVVSEAGKTVEKGNISPDIVSVEAEVEPDIVVNEPDEDSLTPEERRNLVNEERRKAVRSIQEALKIAGRLSANAEQVLGKLLPRGRIRWSNYLIGTATSMLREDFVTTFQRPSRRFEGMPGYKAIEGKGIRAVFAIDVSGSIDDKTLSEFIGETLWAKKLLGDKLSGYVVLWDTGVREVIPLENLSSTVKVTGRGGTVIDPVLSWVLSKAEKEKIDAVVVLTDGYLNLDNKDLPRNICSKVKKCVFVYTGDLPSGFDCWTRIRY